VDADLEQLSDLSRRLRELDGVGVAIAEEARPAIEAAVRATAAAGTTPDGAAWKPRKADGKRALEHAADAISVVVSGTRQAVLTMVLRGPYVFHQKKRPILPGDKTGIPSRMMEIVRDAAKRVVARKVRGGS
jgi:hypothetical protein